MKKKPFPMYDGDIVIFKDKLNGKCRWGTYLSQCEIDGFEEEAELQLNMVVMGDGLDYRLWNEITPGQIATIIMRDDSLANVERYKLTETALTVVSELVEKYA